MLDIWVESYFHFWYLLELEKKVQKDILFHTLINDIRISWSWTSWTSCIKESEISEKKVLLVDIQRRENLEHCREMYLSGGPTWSWTRNFLVSLDAFHLKLCWWKASRETNVLCMMEKAFRDRTHLAFPFPGYLYSFDMKMKVDYKGFSFLFPG